jgi:uncharacterized protein
MDKKEYILSVVKKRIRAVDPNARILLFGSRARKDASPDSDWDFLILTDFEVDRILRNRIYDELFETELETDQVLTGIIQNKEQREEYKSIPIYQNISQDGFEI